MPKDFGIAYYAVTLLNSPLDPLTYTTTEETLETGRIVMVPLQSRLLEGVILGKTECSPVFKPLSIHAVAAFYYSLEQLETARFIASYYFSSLGEALALFLPFSDLEDAGNPDVQKDAIDITLSSRQQAALAFAQTNPVSLLFGDTGSGKTEIYMRYCEAILRQKKRALILMPEISLTPQIFERLKAHFGEHVVLWHSKMTKVQKRKSLEKIRDGSAYIIAGARSALFLPIENLGLIIVDEEHDDSYKSSSRPRYHARDLAVYIGSKQKIPVLLGSATPSLGSYVKYPHFRLKGGYFASQRRFIFEAHSEGMTPLILNRFTAVKAAKKQAILFIPTRANFKYLICDSCGYTYECPYCSVGMSLHKNSNLLRCHYCNFTETIPSFCPQCRVGHLAYSRIGTAEAVAQLKETHPEIATEQFDRDVITTQKKLIEALERFNRGETDLLVGTQMISKGHDYHDVDLAVVLGMDTMLNQSDYRAREKALAMLIQIAGRSGRKSASEVLVQSFNESFFKPYVENYEAFLNEEKKLRENLYPPYKKLARVLFAHNNGTKVRLAMEAMVEKLKLYPVVEIVGFGPSAVEKIAGKQRYQILLRSSKSTDLIRVLKALKAPLAEVDMDPIEFS